MLRRLTNWHIIIIIIIIIIILTLAQSVRLADVNAATALISFSPSHEHAHNNRSHVYWSLNTLSVCLYILLRQKRSHEICWEWWHNLMRPPDQARLYSQIKSNQIKTDCSLFIYEYVFLCVRLLLFIWNCFYVCMHIYMCIKLLLTYLLILLNCYSLDVLFYVHVRLSHILLNTVTVSVTRFI